MRACVTRSVATSLLAFLVGCGGGSNNDQGVGFSLIGFNAVEDGECQEDTFISAAGAPLSDAGGQEGPDIGLFTCATVQNNTTTQFVRTDRMLLEYYIDGASEQPPSTSTGVSTFLGPASGGEGTNPPDSTLPGSLEGVENRAMLSFPYVPVSIREWLSLNRNSLPEPPFEMTVVATVTGVTSAGDRIETNPASLLVVVSPDVPIQPTTNEPEGLEGEESEEFEEGEEQQEEEA
jgi:hypothetical protein